MGASTFVNSYVPHNGETAEQAFSSLTADSRAESGHSYSGEIGMKSGFQWATSSVLTEAEASALADKELDGRFSDKYGPAGAARFHVEETTGNREVVVKVAVDTTGVSDSWRREQMLREAAQAKVRTRKGEVVEHVLDVKVTGTKERLSGGRTPGTSKTVYVLTSKGEMPVDPTDTSSWPRRVARPDGQFDSQADARAAAETFFKNNPSAAVEFTITGKVVRVTDDGSTADALVVLTNERVKVEADVTVRLATKKRTGKVGFMFFGWAAS